MPSDHDLLIELRTEMRGVRDDIKDLKDNTAGRLNDHEARLRQLEEQKDRWLGKQSVIGGFIGAVIVFIGSILSAGKW